ncbi:MAG TPA: BT4734/BF3469 family protein [Candidatus Paceibacterota bacterium]
MEIELILKKEVSYIPSFSGEPKNYLLKDAIEEIRSDKNKNRITLLRSYYNTDKIKYDIEKSKLPSVTFCATFKNKRNKENIENYNQLMILDIDKLSDEKYVTTKSNLFFDPYVFCFWESPSQKGIKGLVALDYKFEIKTFGIDKSHKNAFAQLKKYFYNKYEIILDASGSDFTRLCFTSWDQNLVLKQELVEFPIEFDDNNKKSTKTREIYKAPTINQKDNLYNPLGKNNYTNKQIVKRIISYLKKNHLSITEDYDNWFRVGMALSNSFTYDLGEKYFLELSELDSEKFKKDDCLRMISNCYHYTTGRITFSTIEYLAKEKDFINRNKDTGST